MCGLVSVNSPSCEKSTSNSGSAANLVNAFELLAAQRLELAGEQQHVVGLDLGLQLARRIEHDEPAVRADRTPPRDRRGVCGLVR